MIRTLQSKGIFKDVVQSFAIYHGDFDGFFRLLSYKVRDNSFPELKYFSSPYLLIDRFEIREYYPLINPRAHALGKKNENILNNAFKETYKSFLLYLLQKCIPSPEDLLIFANYLIA